MNVLDDLIKIKKNTQNNDLIKLLDEVAAYDKLSADKTLKDLKNSEITRKKCPLLAGFVDGKFYETILAELAANVYLQIEGQIPVILETATERSLKQQKQIEILQTGIARVEYHELTDYNHETMSPFLAAVFTSHTDNAVTAAIIVKQDNKYKMYHGTYTVIEEEKVSEVIAKQITVNGDHGNFIMNSYSILGNNGYRFGYYTDNQTIYDIMISPDNVLYLINGEDITTRAINNEEKNILNEAKTTPETFASVVTSLIESVV